MTTLTKEIQSVVDRYKKLADGYRQEAKFCKPGTHAHSLCLGHIARIETIISDLECIKQEEVGE